MKHDMWGARRCPLVEPKDVVRVARCHNIESITGKIVLSSPAGLPKFTTSIYLVSSIGSKRAWEWDIRKIRIFSCIDVARAPDSGLRSIKCLVGTTVPSNSASVRGVLCGNKIFEYTQSSVRTFVSVMEDGTRSKRLSLATKSAIVQT